MDEKRQFVINFISQRNALSQTSERSELPFSAYCDNLLWHACLKHFSPKRCQFIWYEIWGLKAELLDAFEFYYSSVFYYTFVYNLTGSFCSVSFAWKGISLVSHFSSHFLSNSIFWALCWFHASHWKDQLVYYVDVLDKSFVFSCKTTFNVHYVVRVRLDIEQGLISIFLYL